MTTAKKIREVYDVAEEIVERECGNCIEDDKHERCPTTVWGGLCPYGELRKAVIGKYAATKKSKESAS